MNKKSTLFCIIAIVLRETLSSTDEVCYKDGIHCVDDDQSRFLFYEVNAPEGFNLRRDVYMRFAVLSHQMQRSKNPSLNKFKLILPPWSHLVHWTYKNLPEKLPWGLYFDLKSLQMFAPVIEMHEFLSRYKNKYSKIVIDEVYTLQHFEDMFETGNFEDRMMIDKCQKRNDVTFFFYENITSHNFLCLSYHGPATKLTKLFLNTSASSILINHAEVALHEFFGNKLYWQARRSMRFNKKLKDIAAEFRKAYLNSTDEKDNTLLPESWKDEKSARNAVGGPYVAVHIRRRDFVKSRANDAPTLDNVASQIIKVLNRLNLDVVYVATDGTKEEIRILSNKLAKYKVYKYNPTDDFQEKYKDGGVAIVDQIICSHSKYFIGTHESTFSFRIQEEREILGFPTETTFNVFCRNEKQCNRPSIWKIVF